MEPSGWVGVLEHRAIRYGRNLHRDDADTPDISPCLHFLRKRTPNPLSSAIRDLPYAESDMIPNRPGPTPIDPHRHTRARVSQPLGG